MKKLIAYSSVAHMGFVTMGIFTLTHQGVEGGIFQMLSHGVVSGALFLCVGVVYDRMHTREIAAYGGLVNRMPIYAACFMVFTLANVGLPGTQRLRRRIPHHAGRLSAQQLDRDFRRHRRDPVGGLCALSLSPHHLRRAGQAGAADHPGSDAARGRDPGAAGGDHHRAGRLSQAGVRRDHAVGRQADPRQQDRAGAGPCRQQGRARCNKGAGQ